MSESEPFVKPKNESESMPDSHPVLERQNGAVSDNKKKRDYKKKNPDYWEARKNASKVSVAHEEPEVKVIEPEREVETNKPKRIHSDVTKGDSKCNDGYFSGLVKHVAPNVTKAVLTGVAIYTITYFLNNFSGSDQSAIPHKQMVTMGPTVPIQRPSNDRVGEIKKVEFAPVGADDVLAYLRPARL